MLAVAHASAIVTHDHPEGIKGAQAVALAVFRARTGVGKEDIRDEVAEFTGYDLARTVEQIRPGYSFDVTCQGSVPEALIAFFDSTSTEHAIRLAISLGGDTDTQACIAGSLAEAMYHDITPELRSRVLGMLPAEFCDVIEEFEERFERRQ